MEIKTLYEDDNFLAVDKPAGLVVLPEGNVKEKTLIEYLVEKHPKLKKVGESPRYGAVHRLDKETSGVLLIAKNNEFFKYLQGQFKERKVKKNYIALSVGNLKEDKVIQSLIGRAPKDRRKQKVFPIYYSSKEKLREAITELRVLKNFKNYTLIRAIPQTGRKHQIRCHLAHIGNPIVGDKLYGFRKQVIPKDLHRHFLHAESIEVKLPDNKVEKIFSKLPEELELVINKIKE